MPKADSKDNYCRTAFYYPEDLTDDVLRNLEGLVNLDSPDIEQEHRENLHNAVTNVLGRYFIELKVVDEAPRPANNRAAAENIRQVTGLALNTLCKSNEVVSEKLIHYGIDVENLKLHLAALFDAARQIERDNEGVESRRAPTKHALRRLIANLEAVFEKYRKRSVYDDDATIKADQLDFIKIAMKGAGVKVPRGFAKYLSIN